MTDQYPLRRKIAALYRVGQYRSRYAATIVVLSIGAAALETIRLSFLLAILRRVAPASPRRNRAPLWALSGGSEVLSAINRSKSAALGLISLLDRDTRRQMVILSAPPDKTRRGGFTMRSIGQDGPIGRQRDCGFRFGQSDRSGGGLK